MFVTDFFFFFLKSNFSNFKLYVSISDLFIFFPVKSSVVFASAYTLIIIITIQLHRFTVHEAVALIHHEVFH